MSDDLPLASRPYVAQSEPARRTVGRVAVAGVLLAVAGLAFQRFNQRKPRP